jgi:hypothetical protein
VERDLTPARSGPYSCRPVSGSLGVHGTGSSIVIGVVTVAMLLVVITGCGGNDRDTPSYDSGNVGASGAAR